MRIPIAYRKDYPIKLRKQDQETAYWDIIRKQWCILTPEEWVRQVIIHYLIEDLDYPRGSISLEKGLHYGALQKRYDILIYDSNRKPWMLIECKRPEVPIDEQVLHQLLIYQEQIQAPYIMLSNGQDNYCAKIEQGKIEWLEELPGYGE